ncbi:hypothetical protein K2X05_12445 [bacterium]|nr:hypothetical protein [bacterium]
MNKVLVFFFFYLIINSATAKTKLPACIKNPKVLKTIQQKMKANAKTNHRYDGYKQALASSSDQEIFTRLAYAETRAANCPEQNTQIATRIVNVIGNRIQKRKGDVKNVVFQPSQFASSLHIYESSKYKDFLCPKNETLWKDVSAKVQNFMKKGSGDLSSDTINYFLYKHDKRWTKEPWDLKENKTGTTDAIRECLKTFHVPRWK